MESRFQRAGYETERASFLKRKCMSVSEAGCQPSVRPLTFAASIMSNGGKVDWIMEMAEREEQGGVR